MGILYQDDLTKSQSKVYLERIARVVDDTLSIRSERIEALRTDIRVLTKRMQDLKKMEEQYLEKNNILTELTSGSGELVDGRITPNPLSTDPNCQAENKANVYTQYYDRDALAQNAELLESSGNSFTIPSITLAQRQFLDRIRTVHKNLNRYAHMIKQTRLTVEMKRQELELILNERKSVGLGV